MRGLNILLGFTALVGTTTDNLKAQETAKTDNSPALVRRVQLPSGSAQPAVVVSEFFTHGRLAPDGKNLEVRDGRRELVPWRLLQIGPGDFCRVAFQPSPGQRQFSILHGGNPAGAAASPPWTAKAGLLLETRHWTDANLNDLASVQQAWKRGTPYGSGYAPTVYQRFNPFGPGSIPFLSNYTGTLEIPRGGPYQFFTSSQDCSFLFIDGKLVVAWPGWHGPAGQARFKGETTLKPGPHTFEYLHAAAGPDACMVAAWQPPGAEKPEPIPPEAFGSNLVASLPAVGPFQDGDRRLHDFLLAMAGEVDIEGLPGPLIRAQFKSPTAGAKARWDFGDGQSASGADPTHIYLHPGDFVVRLSVAGDPESLSAQNTVRVERPAVFSDENHPPDQLAAYLAVLDRYDPSKLDPPSVLPYIQAFEHAGLSAKVIESGKAWLSSEAAGKAEAVSLDVAKLLSPILLDRQADPAAAVEVWNLARNAVQRPAWKGQCAAQAADILLNDLQNPNEAKPLLDEAGRWLASGGEPAQLSHLNRVLGDFHARKGDRPAAIEAYAKAQASLPSKRSSSEREAWRGSLSRSTEAFLKEDALALALAPLRQWQEEFPADKLEGYLSWLQARFQVASGKLDRAIVIAEDLVTVNPDSAYADRLLFLAAHCEEKLGRAERAKAGYQSLLTDYPGSPLVSDARKKLAELAAKPPAAP